MLCYGREATWTGIGGIRNGRADGVNIDNTTYVNEFTMKNSLIVRHTLTGSFQWVEFSLERFAREVARLLIASGPAIAEQYASKIAFNQSLKMGPILFIDNVLAGKDAEKGAAWMNSFPGSSGNRAVALSQIESYVNQRGRVTYRVKPAA
jgi:hypothetical protein